MIKLLHEIADEFITDDTLRKIVNDTIDISTEVLKSPSSTTGKYHPPDENCEYGMVKHILKALALATQGMRRYNIAGWLNTDIVVASVILHDIPYKIQWNEKEQRYHTDPDHALKNGIYFEEKAQENCLPWFLSSPITGAIAFHSGIWQDYSDVFYRHLDPEFMFNRLLQEADFYASRNFVSIDPNPELIKELLRNNLKG